MILSSSKHFIQISTNMSFLVSGNNLLLCLLSVLLLNCCNCCVLLFFIHDMLVWYCDIFYQVSLFFLPSVLMAVCRFNKHIVNCILIVSYTYIYTMFLFHDS